MANGFVVARRPAQRHGSIQCGTGAGKVGSQEANADMDADAHDGNTQCQPRRAEWERGKKGILPNDDAVFP